jgi:S1-C subfamily serine protease
MTRAPLRSFYVLADQGPTCLDGDEMKSKCLWLGLFFITSFAVAASTNDRPPIILKPIVVHGSSIPSGWLTVSWDCKGPLPIDRVKRAWISNVLAGSPADKAGFSIDDTLLALGGVPIETLTGVSLRWNLEREREPGTEEQFLLQSPDGERHLVTMKFIEKTGH